MTTNNTHSEHSDVEVIVAESSPTSETETNAQPAPASVAPPQEPSADESVEASLMETQREPAQKSQIDESVEASLMEAQRELIQESQSAASASASSEGVEHVTPEAEQLRSDPDTGIPPVQEQVASFAAPVADFSIDTQSEPEKATAETVIPVQSLPQQEEVRPFTDFIEEFRQAEYRFGSSLQAYQAESFSPLASTDVEAQQIAPADADSTSTSPSIASQAAAINEPGEPFTLEQPVESQTLAADASTPSQASIPSIRPVSPLLRPASRLRLPRHGTGRHREEPPTEKVISSETARQEPKAESASTEPASAGEPTRPTRRYRFDRRAPAASTSNGSASSPSASVPNQQVQTRTEESKDVSHKNSVPSPARPDNGQVIDREVQVSQQTRQPTTGTQSSEQPQNTSKQSTTQEPVLSESSTATLPFVTSAAPAIPRAPEQGRRRHGQDRQKGKEQTASTTPVAPTPVVEVAPAVPASLPAPTPVKEEAESEELPPLEYSELQKANSRRRRRRHAGSPVVPATPALATPTPLVAKAITPETIIVPPVPTPTPTPTVVMPRTPAAQVTPTSQYNITSGYTVSQMNQEGSGPFMGPDPSPARGTIAAQNVRSIRTDAQRTPAYPVRTTDANSAYVHQLANVVAQAIQTQTDRMVTELRRANQTPSNISVSLPPFPSNERVGVFVDVANLLYSARNLRMTVDFGKLLDFLRGNRRLIRAHAYCPTSPQPGDEQMFLQAVKGLGYRITTKNYKTFSSGAKKADLDLDLCMDVVRLVDGRSVDCIVLVSGDSDFMPMLDYCSDHGVRVEVAAFDESMSATLRQSCDLFINLGMLEEIRA
ncbi:MAG: hypothetical protein NVSMB33_13050 [Ktedonobacteraceae bacterium]